MRLSEIDPDCFIPMHDRLLVERIGLGYEGKLIIPEQFAGAQMSSGLEPPTLSHFKAKICKVLAVGGRVKGVNVGDMVYVPGAGNCYADYEDGDRILIREGDIAGLV